MSETLPILKFLCNNTFFNGVTLFQEGAYYYSPVDLGTNFTQTTIDPLEFNSTYTHTDADGTLYFAGNIANYDDWAFPMNQSKRGSNLKPDYDFENNGYLFPKNNTTEVVYFSSITSHRMQVKPGGLWNPHLHFAQDTAGSPVFEYRIKLAAAGEAIPAWSEWIPTTGVLVFPYVSGRIHQIVKFPSFDSYALGATSFASMIDIQLRRNDNAVNGDVLVKQFDIHVLWDSPLGSGQEFAK